MRPLRWQSSNPSYFDGRVCQEWLPPAEWSHEPPPVAVLLDPAAQLQGGTSECQWQMADSILLTMEARGQVLHWMVCHGCCPPYMHSQLLSMPPVVAQDELHHLDSMTYVWMLVFVPFSLF